MPISNLNEVLREAKNYGYAVGAFNIHNLEFTKGVMQASEKNTSPVIFAIAPASIEYAGLEELANDGEELTRQERTKETIMTRRTLNIVNPPLFFH